jgi:periplasmic divalent cation tolerance protein
MNLLVVLSTFPDVAAARTAAGALVGESLAACVNILPGVESIYRWQGKMETGQEVLAVIKTTAERYPQLEKRLTELHPYDVPEIVAIPASDATESYLSWVIANTQP